jgi:dinuclear metal center YbgI/SA1388 family protein
MPVHCQQVLSAVRDLCPPRFALEGDATGFQIGRDDKQVGTVLTTLDLTLEVAEEARDLGADLVVSHHAVIFRPLRNLRTDRFKGRILETLIKADVAVYVPHTALDVVEGGMNDHLARSVGLENPRFLDKTGQDDAALLVATGDLTVAGQLAAKEEAQAQQVGERLEVILAASRASRLAERMVKKGVAARIVPLSTHATPRGIGRVGTLPKPESPRELGARLKDALGAPGVRVVARDLDASLEKVAVLGGDGRRFMNAALFAGAQALVTGDVDHHTALEARARGLVLIDVGHWASERQVAEILAEGIRTRLEGEHVKVLTSQVDTQPFAFV